MQPPPKAPRLDGFFDQTSMPPMGAMPPMSMLGANPLGAGALGLGALGGAMPPMPPALPPGLPPMPPGLGALHGIGGVPTLGAGPGLSLGPPPNLLAAAGPALGAAARMGSMGKMGGAMPGLVYANMAAAAAMTLASMGQDDTSSDEEEEQEEVPDPFDKDLLARLAKKAAEDPQEPPEISQANAPSASSASSGLVVATATSMQDARTMGLGKEASGYMVQLGSNGTPGSLEHQPGLALAQQRAGNDHHEIDDPVEDGRGGVRIPPPNFLSNAALSAGLPLPEIAAKAEGKQGSESESEPLQNDSRLGLPPALSTSVASGQTLASLLQGGKKDASSVANLLQQVQSNVARGRAGGGPTKSERSLQQAFGMDLSEGPPNGGVASLTSDAFEALLHRLDHLGASSAEVCRALEADVLDTLPNLEPARAAELVLRALAAEALRSTEFLDDVSKAMTPFVLRLGSPHLARVMGSLASWVILVSGASEETLPCNLRLSDDVRAFFSAAAKEVSVRLMDVVTGDLSRIASSLAAVGLGEPCFFSSVARAAAARSERFSPQEVSSLAGAFDKAGLVHTALFEVLARSLRAGFKELLPRDLLMGMRALATCGVRDKELGHNVCTHLLRIAHQGELPAEDFCSLAWTFCALDLYHDKMFRAVFRSLEDAAVVSSETLCQLYEIHVTLKAFHEEPYKEYMLEADTVQGLCDHYKKHRGGRKWEMKLERSSEKLHKDVAETLQDVLEGASVHRQHRTSLGFHVDLAALRKKNSSVIVVLDVDGSHTLMRSLDPAETRQVAAAWRVRGAVMMKRRVLQRHGFRICVVTEDIWRTLEDSKEKREFLREMLKVAGVSSTRIR